MESGNHCKNGVKRPQYPRSGNLMSYWVKTIKMKQTALLIVLLIVTGISVAFKSPWQTSYGPWRTTSCYKGIDFCVKKGAYNEYAKKYEWWVKFRNRYHSTATFSFIAKESSITTAKTNERISIPSGEEASSWFLLAETNSINVFVDKMRFGDDDWGSEYVPCGQ
jgi:hypothetical protein